MKDVYGGVSMVGGHVSVIWCLELFRGVLIGCYAVLNGLKV
jgi:hypothetical protein